jgi:hypothetical protein
MELSKTATHFTTLLFLPAGSRQRLPLSCTRIELSSVSLNLILNPVQSNGYFMHRQIRKLNVCPHSAFMCFVWISEETAIISLYSINWLVFITETERVYCAVRSTFYVLLTQCSYVFCVDLRTNNNISLYSINWLVFIIERECVYCAVRNCVLLNAMNFDLRLQRINKTGISHHIGKEIAVF